MKIQEFLDKARTSFNVTVAFQHPTLYIFCESVKFERLREEARISEFLKTTNIQEKEFSKLIATAIISICLVTKEERETEYSFVGENSGTHWLPLMDLDTRNNLTPAVGGPIPAIHFYGYKGGQARTTVLSMLAKSLASDGYRILVVDCDIEAPSLDYMFEISASSVDSTLMGLCGWGDAILPLPAYVESSTGGYIDLLPCRPLGTDNDMDFAAFGLRVALDTTTLTVGINRLKNYVEEARNSREYDLIIFDHRTGIAPSVLPIIRQWRGPVVISVRPDGFSLQGIQTFSSLFSQNPDNPGAYVCFSMDQEETKTKLWARAEDEFYKLLKELSLGIHRGGDADEEPLEPSDITRYWVNWFYDRAFLTGASPKLDKLSSENQASIRQLREVLSFSITKKQTSHPVISPNMPSPSGATDTGWFIETPEIAKLFSKNTPVNYIVGRKGTGKTRLYREMVSRGLGEPLFAAADYDGGGIPSQGILYKKLLIACDEDYERFWWSLLSISLEVEKTTDSTALAAALDLRCSLNRADFIEKSQSYTVAEELFSSGKQRVFFIDGIETAVPAAKLRLFIEQLLRFMLTLQSDSRLRNLIQIRLFLRSDLLNSSSQNIEQQTNQRVLKLRWDRDSIFNYVLARIEPIPWFKRNFQQTCKTIAANLNLIQVGQMGSAQYEEILLEIFPQKLRRNNLQTLTFLETYFSDASGEADSDFSFYPRLFEAFLIEIAESAEIMEAHGKATIEHDRVLHTIVLDAHTHASSRFVNEVKQELQVLLNLGSSEQENTELVNSLIAAFDGLSTPFDQDDTIKILHTRVNGIDQAKLRISINQMTDVGIFEKHPKRPGVLRVGRLYKSALRMKYLRR